MNVPSINNLIETILCLAISKEAMFGRIEDVAKDFGVSRVVMEYVVSNESARNSKGDFLPCGIGDTHLTTPKGDKHRSRGVVQINEYYNPQVTDASAFSITFSLEFLASKLREGKCSMWTTCRAYMKKESEDSFVTDGGLARLR